MLRRAAAFLATIVGVLAVALGARQALWERRVAALRAERDELELQAEKAERSGHLWAGVYAAMRETYVDSTVIVAPDGRYLASSFERYEPVLTGHAFGLAAFAAPTLTLTPETRAVGGDQPPISGSYRIVRWGTVRCLIRPGEEKRFLDCTASECDEFRPLCTAGLLYGEPDLPNELVRGWRVNRRSRPLELAPPFFGTGLASVKRGSR